MIVITDKEVYSDNNKFIHRILADTYFKRGILIPGENESSFEEIDTIPDFIEVKPISIEEQMKVLARASTRTMSLSNEEALKMPDLFDDWYDLIGQEIEQGRIIYFNGKLYKSRQKLTVQEIYPPSMNTAALYERIEDSSQGGSYDGSIDNPIPYEPPMEIFNGKYYTQDGILYLCNRDSEIALTHNLSELVNQYVTIVE